MPPDWNQSVRSPWAPKPGSSPTFTALATPTRSCVIAVTIRRESWSLWGSSTTCLQPGVSEGVPEAVGM